VNALEKFVIDMQPHDFALDHIAQEKASSESSSNDFASVKRTTSSLEHLGEERAIGRVEDGMAILHGLDVIDRDTAKEKTKAFKWQARGTTRPEWMEKIFGGETSRKK
jgi:hypothetical protein